MSEFGHRWDALAPRRREVLRYRCEGLQNKEIARRMFISPQCVKNHLTYAFRAMLGEDDGGGSRSALVCYQLGRHDAAAVNRVMGG